MKYVLLELTEKEQKILLELKLNMQHQFKHPFTWEEFILKLARGK